MASGKLQEVTNYVEKDFHEKDINIGIEKIGKCIEKLEKISAEKPDFDSQKVDNFTNQIQLTILEIFGEHSFQYQRNKNYKIFQPYFNMLYDTTAENQQRFLAKLPDCREFLEDLIEILNDKRLFSNSSSSPQNSEKASTLWYLFHPQVTLLAKTRFDSKNYADAVEAVFKEINTLVKGEYKKRTGLELDGTDLMQKAFRFDLKKTPQERPVIGFNHLSTESDRNIQQGYQFIFSGAIQAIRNPKAHANVEIDEKRCLHFLMLGSLLFQQLEVAGVNKN